MSYILFFNPNKNKLEVVSATDSITVEELKERYKDHEDLEAFLQCIEEDPYIEYIKIEDRILHLER